MTNGKKSNERALAKRRTEQVLLEEFLALEGIPYEEIVPVDPPSDPLDFTVTLTRTRSNIQCWIRKATALSSKFLRRRK